MARLKFLAESGGIFINKVITGKAIAPPPSALAPAIKDPKIIVTVMVQYSEKRCHFSNTVIKIDQHARAAAVATKILVVEILEFNRLNFLSQIVRKPAKIMSCHLIHFLVKYYGLVDMTSFKLSWVHSHVFFKKPVKIRQIVKTTIKANVSYAIICFEEFFTCLA